MSDAGRNMEEVEAVAAEQGVVAFYPATYELMLDLDCQDDVIGMDRAMTLFKLTAWKKVLYKRAGIRVIGELVTTSKSGKGAHVYIALDSSIPSAVRVALQACLGSDLNRELLSICEVMQSSEVSTVLFETPLEALKVTHWRVEMKVIREASREYEAL